MSASAARVAALWPTYEGWGNCEPCAVQIQRILGGGRIIKISPPSGANWLGPSTNNPGDEPWAYHYAVEKDGRIYDSFTGPGRLPSSEYSAQFEFWEYFEITGE